MAPVPARAHGTTAPTARNLLATATPNSPVWRSAAAIEKVDGVTRNCSPIIALLRSVIASAEGAWHLGPSGHNQVRQRLWELRQHLAPFAGDNHGIGMAEAAHAVHIDPGLDGHDHAGLQHRLIAGREERQLVNVDTDAVPGAVNEGAAKPRLFDETAGGAVHLLARHTGPDRIEGRLLRPPHDLEDLSLVIGRRSDEDRAFILGVIPVGGASRPVD